MATDDEELESTLAASNVNHGNNKNKMEQIEAGGDVVQRSEINQEASERGTVILDPNNRNAWIDLCETISNLPHSEQLVRIGGGAGGVGLVGFVLWFLTPWNGLYGDVPNHQAIIILGIFSLMLAFFALTYFKTGETSRCPECGMRFALRTAEVRKTGRTEICSSDDIIHGERDRECRECGYSVTVTEEWTPDELSR